MTYDTKDDAERCEDEHTSRLNNAEVISSVSVLKNKFGLGRAYALAYPEKLKIKFSGKDGDYAIYTFESSGPKGV
jgi:hypothetical protein